MPLSKSKIIKAENKERAVLNYEAQKIVKEVFELAEKVDDFSREEAGEASPFKMDELLKQRTGVAEQRQAELMNRVEERTIEQLKLVEEEGYQKAYELGLAEGRTQGLQDAADHVHQRLAALDEMLNALSHLKSQLIIQNEAEIVKLAYSIGNKIALRNIEEDPAYIVDLLSTLSGEMQGDTEVVIKLSAEDFKFVEKFKSEDPRNSKFLEDYNLAEDISLKNGECVFESNAGDIEATLEDRVKNLWSNLVKNLPRIEEDPDQESAS